MAANKHRATIKALLESKARADEIRRRAEESYSNSEKLVQVLGAQVWIKWVSIEGAFNEDFSVDNVLTNNRVQHRERRRDLRYLLWHVA